MLTKNRRVYYNITHFLPFCGLNSFQTPGILTVLHSHACVFHTAQCCVYSPSPLPTCPLQGGVLSWSGLFVPFHDCDSMGVLIPHMVRVPHFPFMPVTCTLLHTTQIPRHRGVTTVVPDKEARCRRTMQERGIDERIIAQS